MAEEARFGLSAGARCEFTTTHWSVVLAAGQQEAPQASEALEKLCRTYWCPLYVYVRPRGHGVESSPIYGGHPVNRAWG